MDIYRNGSIVKKVHPSDSDKVTKKVMGDNTLSLSFDLTTPFIFAIGDYCFFDGEKYTLNILPKVKKNSRNQFEYDMILEGVEYELRKVQHLYYTANLEFTGGSDFSLMGDASLHARIIVENLNRVQSGWTVGNVISSDAKNITFSNNNCKEALNKIVEEFGTEYWIGSDKTINIEKKGDILPITLEYGKNKGLYSIERENVNTKDVITRLYPFGSTSNLIKGYRNNAKRLQISTNYIEKNVDKYGVIESSQIFEDIKPERTGTISAIGADIFTFVDSSMDFDLKAESGGNTLYLIPGTAAKIHFQTGDLAGYEFELFDYNHSTKTFIINKFTNEVAYDLPNNTLKPRVGDKYIILDIYMPQSYVDAAEARLLAKAQESLNQNSEPNVAYKVVVDPLFIKNLGLIPKRGDYVSILDDQLNIDRDIRIVSIVRSVNNPNEIDIDLADTIEPSLTSKIETTLENQDIVLKINKLNDPARARRNYKVVQELQNAIFDQDGYFDNGNIKPFSIETNMLSVGSKGQQFYTDCLFQANYLGAKNNIVVGNGSLAHFTIEDNVKTWSITGLTETVPDDNLRYIFIKCLKAGNTGQVILSSNQLAIDDGTYYNFFAGVLSSVIDNARQVSLLFGFTTINGRFVKTGRVQSADGLTYFDLDTGVIAGKISFIAGSSGYSNLVDKPDLSVYSLQADVNAIVANLQAQIDGQIMSWFDTYVPTLSNAPASGWTTTALKDAHLGDLFYNKTTGLGYRFSKTGSVYSWELLKDTDVALALANAATAQDTADGKRRVFVSQPTTPYEVGDLWSQGTVGDLMKCKVERLTGSYNAADWEKASKYTDDTAAIAAQQTANQALLNLLNWNGLKQKAFPIDAASYQDFAQSIVYSAAENEIAYALSPYGAMSLLWHCKPENTTVGADGGYITKNITVDATKTYRFVTWFKVSGEKAGYIYHGTKPNTVRNLNDDALNANPYFKYVAANTLTADRWYLFVGFIHPHAHTGTESFGGVYDGVTGEKILSGTDFKFDSATTTIYLRNLLYDTANPNVNVYFFGAMAHIVNGTEPTIESILSVAISLANNAAAKAAEFNYLKNALQGSTEISGGLLSTNVLLMKNLADIITGGMSGLSDDNVAFWGGGTYAEAIAALAKILFNKDGSGHLAGGKISFNQYGGLNVGDFKIQGGAIDGYADNKVKVRFKVGELPSLASLIAGQVVQDPTSYSPTHDAEFENFGNPGAISESFDFVDYGELIVPANTTVYFTHPDFDLNVTGGSIQSQSSYFKIKLGSTVIGTYGPSVPSVILTAGGTYIIEHHVEGTITIPRDTIAFVEVVTNTAGYLSYNIGVERTEIGKDGFYSFWETSLYLYFSLLEGLKYKGAMDIPGVLAAASVASGGGSSNKWGAKVDDSSKSSTGTYVISHSVGSVEYNVIVTPRTGSRTAYVSSKSEDSVTIITTNLSGTNADSAFDYAIIGNN